MRHLKQNHREMHRHSPVSASTDAMKASAEVGVCGVAVAFGEVIRWLTPLAVANLPTTTRTGKTQT